MKRFSRALILFAILISVLAVSNCSAQTNSSEILLQRARTLESQNHLDLAARAWDQVLLSEPKNVEALTGLARYAEQQGNTKEAEQYLQKAKSIDPNASLAPKSEAAQHRAIDSTTLTPEQNSKLQEAARLSADHKSEEAMQLYRELFKDRPPDGAYALAYYETLAGIPAERNVAITRLHELAKRHADDPRYALAAAQLLTYSPQTRAQGLRELEAIHGDAKINEQARAAWRQALLWEKGNPAYESSVQQYVKTYSDSSLESEFGPVQPHRSAADIAKGNEEQTAYKALQQGNLQEAESIFEKLRLVYPTESQPLLGLAFVRMKQERFAEAVELLEATSARGLQKDKNVQQTLETARFWKQMQAGKSLLDEDRLEEASASFHQALLLRPDSPDAIRGVAGTLMKEGDFNEAIPLYQRLISLNRDDAATWKLWLGALEKSGNPSGVINAAKTMPASVKSACADDVEFIVTLAAAYAASGDTAQSRQLIQKAIALSGSSSASAGTQMQLASLLVQVGMITQAIELYVRLTEQNAENLDVWSGLIAALHAADKDSQALAVSGRMPRSLFQQATKKADFLMLMASIYESSGQLESAHRFLEQAMQIVTQNGKQMPVNLQLQVAGLWLREKEYAKAAETFDQVLRKNPENVDAWRGKLTALHEAHQDSEVVGEFYTIDPNLREQLTNDPAVAGLLASAYLAQGQKEIALQMIRRAAWRYESIRKPMPVDLQVQTCWILMDSGEDGNLDTELMALTSRKDLNSEQSASVEQIWATWSQKKAERMASLGEYHQALSVLYTARHAFPTNAALRSSFANMLLRAGYTSRAFEDYASWGLAGGSEDDYVSGIGAAMATRELKTAENWLQTALRLWPDDPKMLLMGAKVAAARGDYGRANKYYQSARLAAAAAPQQNGSHALPGENSQNQNQAVRELSNLLAPGDNRTSTTVAPTNYGQQKPSSLDELHYALPTSDTSSPNSFSHRSTLDPKDQGQHALSESRSSPSDIASPSPMKSNSLPLTPASTRDNSIDSYLNSGPSLPAQNRGERLQPINQKATSPQNLSPSTNFYDSATSNHDNSLFSSNANGGASPVLDPSPGFPAPHSEVQSEIDAMYAQFSPYVGMGGFVAGRSGQTGFDHLIAQGSDLEASTTLGNEARLTAIVKPVFLDAGGPETNTTLQLGTLPLGTAFPALSASGVGAELQVATQNFGARLGVSPEGFLVSNFIGSVVFRPAGGPFQISVVRAPVRDTLLSFAGVRDPGTDQVWGGVISNGASGTASWNTNNSGLYAEFGYQYITGDHVETNQRYDGTAGSYWRVLTKPYGALTVGLNFSAMHYDYNLRYFTFGQGGYFSPQSYFLFNVPISWKGTYHDRFEYSVDTSFGSQHFTEDSTPYYPLEVNSQAVALASRNAATNSILLHPIPVPTPKPIVPVAPVVLYYPSQTVTSINYSLILKGGYRLDKNWFAGGFIDLNNARDYTSTSAGIYVRYQPRPISLDTPLTENYLPQPDSIRGLILP